MRAAAGRARHTARTPACEDIRKPAHQCYRSRQVTSTRGAQLRAQSQAQVRWRAAGVRRDRRCEWRRWGAACAGPRRVGRRARGVQGCACAVAELVGVGSAEGSNGNSPGSTAAAHRKIRCVRLAWFTPLRPVTSGVARLFRGCAAWRIATRTTVDVFVASAAEWRTRACRRPLRPLRPRFRVAAPPPARTTSSCISSATPGATTTCGPTCSSYPGLVVLHDAHLHHARASSLLGRRRPDDYAAEFVFNQPDVPPGTSGDQRCRGFWRVVYYFWPMIRSRRRCRPAAWPSTTRWSPPISGDTYRRGSPSDVIRLGVPIRCRCRTWRGRTAASSGPAPAERLGMAPEAFVVLAVRRRDARETDPCGDSRGGRGTPPPSRSPAADRGRDLCVATIVLADARAAGVAGSRQP